MGWEWSGSYPALYILGSCRPPSPQPGSPSPSRVRGFCAAAPHGRACAASAADARGGGAAAVFPRRSAVSPLRRRRALHVLPRGVVPSRMLSPTAAAVRARAPATPATRARSPPPPWADPMVAPRSAAAVSSLG